MNETSNYLAQAHAVSPLAALAEDYYAKFHEGPGLVKYHVDLFLKHVAETAATYPVDQTTGEVIEDTAMMPYEKWRDMLQISDAYAARLAYHSAAAALRSLGKLEQQAKQHAENNRDAS